MNLLQTTIRPFLSLVIVVSGIFYLLRSFEATQVISFVALGYYIPSLSILFLVVRLLSPWLMKILHQPPLMVFILEMVIKIIIGLTLFLIYILNKLGPANEGAFAFVIIYLIFEFLEIKRFLSILRPDSPEKTPE